ncbi:MAG: DMT family transporter [Porphyromonas gingivalis]
MTSSRLYGLAVGILSSATFGLIPLFTLPVSAKGASFELILFYRFFFAAIAIGILHRLSGGSFKVSRADIGPLVLLGFLYAGTALFLFHGYGYMASGVATTIHFLYPLFVTALMLLFFGERFSPVPLTAIFIALIGVGLLMGLTGGGDRVGLTGFVIVAISALCYALYIVFVNRSRIRIMPGRRLTFYVFVAAAGFCLINVLVRQGEVAPLPDAASWGNILLLALVPTVISNLALVVAVRNIGSTLTSALGAMEPLTSVLVGVWVFHEVLGASAIVGMGCILIAVGLIVFSEPLELMLRRRRR